MSRAVTRRAEKCLSTWVREADYFRFRAQAQAKGVTISEYLWAIIVDAMADEDLLAQKSAKTSSANHTSL